MVEDPIASTPDSGILDSIRLQLGLDSNTFNALVNTIMITCCSLSLFIALVVTTNRRRRGETKVESEFVNENWVDLESPDSDSDHVEVNPVVLVDEESQDESQQPTDEEVDEVKIVATIEPGTVDVEDPTPSGRAARASRREKRAAEAEMKQVLEEMHKAIEESGLPPLPTPGELPPPGNYHLCQPLTSCPLASPR